MSNTQPIRLLYGREGVEISVPSSATILRAAHGKALPNLSAAVSAALESPIASASLAQLLRQKRPASAAITISDITRPVPNKIILPPLLEILNRNGLPDAAITIIVGTGMHRPSTPAEKIELVGPEILRKIRVIDHIAEDPAGLVQIAHDPAAPPAPPVSINRTFMQADFRIVTGLIEPHFMAGYSGGRKGVCPALVDLQTVQRFHGHQVMGDPRSASGILEGNPCHAESLRIARLVPVDFLVNVAINGDRDICGIYTGNMEAAHAAGVQDVARWTSAHPLHPFDLIITSGGGYPLDKTFYQTGKGMVTALPACHKNSTILILAQCEEGVGSESFTRMMFEWSGRWREFLAHIATVPVKKDQWQVQMLCRVMELVGENGVRLVSEGLAEADARRCWVTPVTGPGSPAQRAQSCIDAYRRDHPEARIAVIPEGPYTMLV